MQLKLRLTRFFIFTFFSLTISVLSANSENQREELILAAKNYLGTPYRYGGASKAGIDCSGLVYMAALDSGLAALPRTARGMYNKAERISDSERQAGDLVFFSAYGLISHVGIYLGDGKFIHSASDGPSTGVIISNLSENYWKRHYFSSGRFISPTQENPEIQEEKNTQEKQVQAQEKNTRKKQIQTQEKTVEPKTKFKAEPKSKTEKEIKTSNTTRPQTEKSQTKKNAGSVVDMTGFFDWTVNQTENPIIAKGSSAQIDIRADRWAINPGIFASVQYTNNKDNALLKNLSLPVGISFSAKKIIGIYAGVCLPLEPNEYREGKIKSEIPSMFGLRLQLPEIPMGNVSMLFTQDISYNCKIAYKAPLASFVFTSFEENILLRTGLTFRFRI